jgi:hypothetical protein
MTSRSLATLALLASGCAPLLPPEPHVQGPDAARPSTALATQTRELVWMKTGRTVRIQRTAKMCHEGVVSEACVRVSSGDLYELDRFFGAKEFRERWESYWPCPKRLDGEVEAFIVTFADGSTIGKLLDAPMGTPLARNCDRAMRDTVAAIGDELEKRYFRRD